MFLSLVAPFAPVVLNLTDVTITESVTGIYLWPVEQRNGPIRWLLALCCRYRQVAFPLDGVDFHVDVTIAFGASGTKLEYHVKTSRVIASKKNRDGIISHHGGIQWIIEYIFFSYDQVAWYVDLKYIPTVSEWKVQWRTCISNFIFMRWIMTRIR